MGKVGDENTIQVDNDSSLFDVRELYKSLLICTSIGELPFQ